MKRMKKWLKCFALLLAAALLLCSCAGAAKVGETYPDSRSEMTKWAIGARQTEFSPRTVEHGEDGVIQWADPAMEAHIRFLLNKPEGEIRRSDVWDIQVLRLNENGIDAAWTQPSEGETFSTADSVEDADHLAEGGTFDPVMSLQDLRYFDSLQSFRYIGKPPYSGLTDLSGLEECSQLKVLSIYGAKPASLASLAALTGLKSLTLSNCGNLDLTPLEGLEELSVVCLGQSDVLASLEPLTALPKLRYLDIGDGTTYPSLEPLTRTGIEFLEMGLGVGDEKSCKGLDYEPLTRMPTLQYLSLMNHLDVTTKLCKQIAAGSPNLRGLDISYTPAANHKSVLADLDVEWVQDAANHGITEFWRRLLYKLG